MVKCWHSSNFGVIPLKREEMTLDKKDEKPDPKALMRQVSFGSTGQKVSEICLGTMMFGNRCGESEADRIVSSAVDEGVTFLDTAAMYCDGLTEEILGRILKERRKKLFLATKVHEGIDAYTIKASLERSLKRLQTDFVDLYMIHWPKKGMNPKEIMQTLHEIVQAGKARFVGCCNYPAWLLAHSNNIARHNSWSPLVCNQIPYNIIERGVEMEVLPQAVADDIAITTYRTLVMGLLAGKYRPGHPLPEDSRGNTDDRISAWLHTYGSSISWFLDFASDLHISPQALSLAWVRNSPAITCPILGVSSLEQWKEGIEAFKFDLTKDQYVAVTEKFNTDIQEESGGDYKMLRRELKLLSS